ncbi:MAG TPA: hypothetical protein PK127_06445, partial [Clostridiales bacterium]|nr:hypothetical protein [Clostridiales bacterium]
FYNLRVIKKGTVVTTFIGKKYYFYLCYNVRASVRALKIAVSSPVGPDEDAWMGSRYAYVERRRVNDGSNQEGRNEG